GPATAVTAPACRALGRGWASSWSRLAAAAATGRTRATYPDTTPSAPSAATGAPRSSCPSTPTSTTRYWPPNTASSTTSCATTDTTAATADRPRHHHRPQPMSPAAHLPNHQQGQLRRAIPPIWRLLSLSWSGPSATTTLRRRTGARLHRAGLCRGPIYFDLKGLS